MRASHYAQALYDLSRDHVMSEEELCRKFFETLVQNGHAHTLPKILKSYERIAKKEARKSTIEVTGATSMSEESVALTLKQAPFKNLLTSTHKKVIRKTDDTLIGGVVVRTNTRVVDASDKRMLLNLYQSITSQ